MEEDKFPAGGPPESILPGKLLARAYRRRLSSPIGDLSLSGFASDFLFCFLRLQLAGCLPKKKHLPKNWCYAPPSLVKQA
jgi:hypothetical protein